MAINKHNLPPSKKDTDSKKHSVNAQSEGAHAENQGQTQDFAKMKSSLRTAFKAKRKMCPPEFSEQINQSLLKHIRTLRPTICAGYYAINDELSVLSAMTDLAQPSTLLALPVVTGPNQPLIFKQWQPGDPLQQGAFKIAEPLSDAPTLIPDCIIVPLLAFDDQGFRLGYGGGFYDRTLAEIRQKHTHLCTIGAGYDAQKSTNPLPVDQYDQKLDYIVTEKEILDFTGRT